MRRLTLIPLLAAGLVALVPAAPASTASELKAFQSPSGNIHCLMDAKFARCDIVSRSWKVPRKPKSCELDYGQGLAVVRRGKRGVFVCAGDTAINNQAKRLAYGRTVRRGGLRCTSRVSGVTCKNSRGHGFRIAKQSYRRF